MLRQGLDLLGRVPVARDAPGGFKLLTGHLSPLGHESHRARRQLSGDHGQAADCDHGLVLGVLSMEVRRLVIVEVHRDHDSVEEAEARHHAIMSDAPDPESPASPTTVKSDVRGGRLEWLCASGWLAQAVERSAPDRSRLDRGVDARVPA